MDIETNWNKCISTDNLSHARCNILGGQLGTQSLSKDFVMRRCGRRHPDLRLYGVPQAKVEVLS
jgi:hypothetical protein